MKNLTIGKQLALGFGFLLTFLIAAIIFSLYQQSKLADLTETEFEHPFAVTNAVARADGNMMRMSRAMKDAATSTDHTQFEHFVSIVNSLEPKVQADLALSRERFLGDRTDFDALISRFNEWKPIRDRVFALKSEGKLAESIDLTRTEGAAKLAEIEDMRKKVYATAWKKGEELHAKANEVRQSSQYWTIGSGMLIIILGIAIAGFITHSLTRPIYEAIHVANAVAAGDLTINFQVDGSKEAIQLLTALKEMQNNLTKIVLHVRHESESIATASAQIASGNSDLSSRTESQAGALEETASSMEELTSTVKQNADNARQANLMAQTTAEIATKGGLVVSDVVTTMDAINDSSKKIVDIIGVIDGIAFQTNILALNAAVEAARAGEQGRGFAVVASEVRNLAQRSASAAKEIKELIGNSVEKVETGNRLVSQAGSTMTEMVESIKHVTNIMGEITEASREQSAGIDQINTAIAEMDNVTQQNAALVEEAAAAAGSMQDQAARLLEAVSVFKLNDALSRTTNAIGKSVPLKLGNRNAGHPRNDA